MHEMSLMQGLLDIVRQEMAAHQARHLQVVKVTCGQLSGVVPDALDMAFTALTQGTNLEGAKLDLHLDPLHLRCGQCGQTFSPGTEECLASFAPCPHCGNEIGHAILSGQDLLIEYIEAD